MIFCNNCGKIYNEHINAFWDESGSFSVKYCQCPRCNETILSFPKFYDHRNVNGLCQQYDKGKYSYEQLNFEDLMYSTMDVNKEDLEDIYKEIPVGLLREDKEINQWKQI